VGGLPGIIRNGENGYLCEVDQVDAFASKIQKLLDEEGLGPSIGKRSREFVVGELDLSSINGEYLKVFDVVLAVPNQDQRC